MHELRLRVAAVSWHPLDQAALEALVATLPGLEVVAVDAEPPPNVILWDGGPDSSAAMPARPGSATVLLTTRESDLAIRPGIAGILSRDEGPESLAAAIRQVARGEQYLSASLIPVMLAQLAPERAPARPDVAELTEREREILTLVGQGLSNKAIAARLYLSVRTVEGHLARLYARLGIHTRTEAMLIAIQSGLAPQIR
jgi:DNA-binding NarL/FixJ family response regulator